MKPLAVIRHQETAPLGIIEEVFEQEGVPWHYHDCWTNAPLPSVDDVSGLVVLGGAMNADEVEDFPYLLGVRDLVRDVAQKERPVLGICLGAQTLALALGADVYRAPERELGFLEVTETGIEDEILAPFSPSSRVFQFHEDTCSLPEGAELLFTSRDVAVQAFRWGRKAYGIQFHLEVTMREIEAWCDEVDDLEGSWGMSKQEVLEQANQYLGTQQRAGRDLATRFARSALGSSGMPRPT